MKLLRALLLLVLTKRLHCRNLSFEQQNLSNLCEALDDITKVLNFNGASTISFITSDSPNSFKAKKFFSEVLKSAKFAYRRETASGIKKALSQKRTYTVLAICNFEEFVEILSKMSSKVFNLSGFYLILLINGEIPEVQEMFELLWQLQIYNVNVMFEDENGEVLVKTFMPFSPGKCGNTTPVLINKFKDGKFQNSDELFPKKLKNLHNCPIRVAVTNNNPPYVIETFSAEGTRLLSGRDFEVLQVLSKSLNFKVDYSYIGPVISYSRNKTEIGPFTSILDNRTDMTISNWWLKVGRLEVFATSNSYASDQIVFIVPPGKKFTALEKLVFPFKLATWFLILLVFVIGTSVIVIMKFQSKAVRDFVLGTGIQVPMMNMIGGFLGLSLRKLPGRNFARFLLMMFLMYSLVIRTVYQGSFYRLMKSNAKHREVQTINEMIKKDFKFCVHVGNEDLYQSTEISKKIFNKTVPEMRQIRPRVNNGSEEGSVYESTMLGAFYHNDQNDASNQRHICKEVFVTVPEVIYAKKDFFLITEINEKLNQLVSSGLIKFWTFRSTKTKKPKPPRKVLSLSQLQGSFGILIAGAVFSSISFLCEKFL
jgi:hypothetical protein